MTQKEIKKILDNHKHWLTKDCEGWENMRANLYGANLKEADLRRANLQEANLYGADLRRANLHGSNLYGADLYGANLQEANLYGANLRRADLQGAKLYGANLKEANLYRANLQEANLYGANLRRADLKEANLYRADLYGTFGVPYAPMICPEEGEFIGWKKSDDGIIIKLHIPEDAKRSSATTRKCRCSKARVIGFYDFAGKEIEIKEVKSHYDKSFTYRLGEIVEVEDYDEDRWNECSKGIYFFMQRQEAKEYVL